MQRQTTARLAAVARRQHRPRSTALVAGEGVLYVRPGLIYPEVTLAPQTSPTRTRRRRHSTSSSRASAPLANASVTTAVIPGVGGAKKVVLGPVAVYFGISTTPS